MKINKEKYTFVITAYNIEKYLTPCMNSILAQTNTHFKIILVDDGSTDATAQLCDNYAKKHSNISVIHKKNGGASSARNAGIKAVKTDYIIFVDGDDFWDDKYALENINNEISKYQPDILCFSGKSFYEDSNKYINMRYSFPEKMNNMSPEESFNYQVTHDLYTPCPWLKVIKKEFLIKNKLYFIE